MRISLNLLNVFPPNKRKLIIDKGVCTDRNWDLFSSWQSNIPALSWDMVSDGNLLYVVRYGSKKPLLIAGEIDGEVLIYDYTGHHGMVIDTGISNKIGSLKSMILISINATLRDKKIDCYVIPCKSKHKNVECPGVWIKYCNQFIKPYLIKNPKKHKNVPYFEDFEKAMEIIKSYPTIARPPKI